MPSPKTLASRNAKHPVMLMVCALCLRQNPKKPYTGGTLQRSHFDGLLYHPDHLPEQRG